MDVTSLSKPHYLVSCIVSAILFLAVSMLLYYRNKHSYWQSKGVIGPKPLPVLGNLLPLLLEDRMQLEKDRLRDYGKVYGIYQGSEPHLVVSDAELIRQISIKDFDTFTNHDTSQFLNKYEKEFLFIIKDDRWKHVRSILSCTFTSGKIKRMYKLLDTCSNDLVEAFLEEFKHSGVMHLMKMFNMYTMNAIATCCYGMKLQRRSGTTTTSSAASGDNFIRITAKIFEMQWSRLIAATVFPNYFLEKLDFHLNDPNNFKPLSDVAERLLRSRRHQMKEKKFDDYMQLLIEARSDDRLELDELDLQENHHAGLTAESLIADRDLLAKQSSQKEDYKRKTLTDTEILSSTMLLLAAGLEPTASLLTHCVYALAFHRDFQERLYEEIAKVAEWDGTKTSITFDYDSLTTCRYMDAVISETLRTLAPALITNRVSSRDYYIEKYNIHLPKSSKVILSLYAAMNDPDYWHKPDRFDPDRFMPGNKEGIVPGSYCPFGLGPRHCLAMRFVLTESKIALAKLMMSFQFDAAPNTKFPPSSATAFNINKIKNPYVRLIKRSNASLANRFNT